MVRIREGILCDFPSGVPIQKVIVYQQAHQLGDADGGMSVVQLRMIESEYGSSAGSDHSCHGQSSSSFQEADQVLAHDLRLFLMRPVTGAIH